MPLFVIHYHEIALKGGNRSFFESVLNKNLKRAFEGFENLKIEQKRDHFRVLFPREEDEPMVRARLKEIFGVACFSLVEREVTDFDAVTKHGIELIQKELDARGLKAGEKATFRVNVIRRNKQYPMTSLDLEREISARILPSFTCLQVKLEKPELALYVDWGEKETLLYLNKIPGLGGLPVGTSGKLVSLISSGFDSPVASFCMMGRGAKIIFVHFHSYPAVGPQSIENVEALVKRLNRFQFEAKLYLISLIEYQKKVVADAPAPLRVVLYRRMMVRMAEKVMFYEGAKGLITGESVGQVASQTLDNLIVTDAVASRPIYRPLIGMNKDEIIRKAEKIGTAEISSQPYDDCCSLYVPKAPALSAKLPEVEAVEEGLEVERYSEELWGKKEIRKL